jgi:hypothetical protein
MIPYLLLLLLLPGSLGDAQGWTGMVSRWYDSATGMVLRQKSTPARMGPCGLDLAGRGGMQESALPQLRELAEYETVCEARFSDSTMLFSPMPTDVTAAVQQGRSMARMLKEFDTYSVAPLVILEPTTATGTMLPVATIADGTYDAALLSYYQTLKDNGITDAMMGTWVPMPEANTPVWGSTDPKDFGTAVTKVAKLQKQRFPASKTSILLGSQSYPSNDVGWKMGAYKSLRPYVANIPSGLIDSFGYQGFPWVPPATTKGTRSTDPKAFLRTDFAIEAAEHLGVRDIWFNTGTFGRSHTAEADEMVVMKPAERLKLLKGIVAQANSLQRKGYQVAIHLFAEDKSASAEAIDWSYWQQGAATSGSATPVFRQFVRLAVQKDIAVWIYDDDHKGLMF